MERRTALREPHEAAEAASEIEDLGYTALWFPDAGGDVFGAVENLLRATQRISIPPHGQTIQGGHHV